MNLDEVMSINVDNLKRKQYSALKEHALKRLEEMQDLIRLDMLGAAKDRMVYSPAGDGYGEDNYFIDFGYREGEPLDLSDILDYMEGLK